MPVSYKAEGTLEIFTYRLQGRNLKVKNFNSKAMASAGFFLTVMQVSLKNYIPTTDLLWEMERY